jgi:hypothetical protein
MIIKSAPILLNKWQNAQTDLTFDEWLLKVYNDAIEYQKSKKVKK